MESEDEVFAQKFSCEESDFWDCDDAGILMIAMIDDIHDCDIAGSLSNNYFPLNKSPSLYQQCFIYSITAWKNTYLKNYSL